VLCALLAQAQPLKLAVVQGSNLGVPEARAADLTRSVVELARLEGLDAAAVEPPCPGQACALEAAREHGADALVSVGFAALGRDAVMDLDARTITGELLAQLTVTVRGTLKANLLFEHQPFLRKVKRALGGEVTEPEPPLIATPRVEPQPPAAPPQVAAAPRSPSKVPYVTGAAALGAAVASAVLFGVNVNEQPRLRSDVLPRELVPQAVAYDDRTTLATSLLIGAGVALVLTIVLFAIQ
jgi:hypothetical protein